MADKKNNGTSNAFQPGFNQDPSALTVELVRESIAALDSKIHERFLAMDKALALLHADAVRVPTDVDKQILHLRELLTTEIIKQKEIRDEVFDRINVQFVERDKRTEQLALASSTAIAAALQAAKEAVGAQNTSNSIAIAKSESSTLESLRQLRELFLSDSRATNAKIDDIKARMDTGQGQQAGSSASWVIFLGCAGFLISLITLGILVSKALY